MGESPTVHNVPTEPDAQVDLTTRVIPAMTISTAGNRLTAPLSSAFLFLFLGWLLTLQPGAESDVLRDGFPEINKWTGDVSGAISTDFGSSPSPNTTPRSARSKLIPI